MFFLDKLDIKDPMLRENFIFLVVGIMLGVIFNIVMGSICSKGDKGEGKTGDNESDWEDDSEDEANSNANVVQSPEKDKALFQQFPCDDIKMMLAVRTDLGMTKGKIGA